MMSRRSFELMMCVLAGILFFSASIGALGDSARVAVSAEQIRFVSHIQSCMDESGDISGVLRQAFSAEVSDSTVLLTSSVMMASEGGALCLVNFIAEAELDRSKKLVASVALLAPRFKMGPQMGLVLSRSIVGTKYEAELVRAAENPMSVVPDADVEWALTVAATNWIASDCFSSEWAPLLKLGGQE